ncbi:MAG: amidohydrolase [Deltaproteobacteria bacterium]|nr:MAG: amidohydrolase [Deltaproteobacteria bacterium]
MKQHVPAPEMILINGVIRTQDPRKPLVEAVAIGGRHMLATGGNKEIQSLAGSGSQVIDLGGRLCLPGMMDSHFHYYTWALGRRQLMLVEVRSFAELLDRVSTAAGTAKEGKWIVGQGWNEADWPEARIPTREDLDKAAPTNPVALWRCDLHMAVVNSMALQLAHIHEGTPDPPEGVIARDDSGRPNGILREFASNLVRDVIPPPNDDEIYAAMQDGIHVFHSLGLTGLEDVRLMGGEEGVPAFKTWQCLRDADALELRCWVSIPGERLEEAVSLGLRTGFGDDHLRIGHVKYFADGGMGARTAWMLEPYLDADCGMPLTPMAELARSLRRADEAGLAVAIHSIGDRANRELITVFEGLREKRGTDGAVVPCGPNVSNRIEHVQMIRPEDLARLAKLDIVVCVQPHNLVLDIGMIDESVGTRGKWTYPYRDLLDSGINVVLSSDAPVCDPSPLVGIHAAVTRQRRDGTPKGGWYPLQRISIEDAVRGYTILPAMSYGVGDRLGSITPGKYADMVILDRDIYTIEPMEIIETKVDMTIFDGRIVFERI